jgi:hypothetical protein
MKTFHFLIFIYLFTFLSCKFDDNLIGPNDKGKIVIKLTNYFYYREVTLNYRADFTQEYSVSKFKYYLSNFKFKKADGSEYVYPKDKSYFLIVENGTKTPTILNFDDIPAGDYIGLSFIVGVDSLKSTSPIEQRSGVLATSDNEMYWSFNSGYIFLKLEGTSTKAPFTYPERFGKISLHIGGYGGANTPTINNLRTVTLSTNPEIAQVRKNATPTIVLGADMMQIFNGTTNLDFATTPEILFTPYSLKVSENYSKMFRYIYLYSE